MNLEIKRIKSIEKFTCLHGLKPVFDRFGADGGASKPSAYLKNLKDIELDLTENRENTINVGLTFRKEIKVI